LYHVSSVRKRYNGLRSLTAGPLLAEMSPDMRRAFFFAAVGLGGLALATTANAETVAVISFDISGGNDAVQRELAAGFAGGLSAGGSAVTESAIVDAALRKNPGLRGCDTATCAERLAQLLGVQRIARGRVTVDGTSYALVLELADGNGGRVLGTIVDRCDVCTVKEAADRVSSQARALLAKISYVPPAPAPAPVAATPSPSLVIAQPPPPKKSPALRIGKWGAAAVALAFIATSIVMFAENGRGACDSPTGVECPTVYDTNLEGGIFVGLGVVSAVAAATLFYLDR
jgi:hypothetical protein